MRRLLTWGAATLILVSGAVRAQAESFANPHVKLQWIDAAGGVVDLDWKTRTRWIWKQVTDKSTGDRSGSFIQISIELPQHLTIELPAGSHAQLLEVDAEEISGARAEEGEEDATGATLILETQSPNVVEKLKLSGESSSNSQVGLAVTLTPSAPKILLHPTCLKEGLQVDAVRGDGSFLFLSAHCQRDPKYLRVTFQTSQDADVVDASGKVLSRDSKMECLLPKADPNGPFLGELHVAHQLTRNTTLYQVSWTGKDGRVGKGESSNSSARAGKDGVRKMGDWRGEIGLGPSLLFYSGANRELALSARGQVMHGLGDSDLRFSADMSLPLFPLTRQPFLPLASGVYQGGAGLRSSDFHAGEFKFAFQPGVRALGVHLAAREDVPHFALGPDLIFIFKSSVKNGNPTSREWCAQLGFTLLGGGGAEPFFHGYLASARVAYPLPTVDLGIDLSLAGGVEYIKLNRVSDSATEMVSMNVGAELRF